MFTLGLGLTPADFGRVLRRPRAVALGLVGQMVLVPALAWGLNRSPLGLAVRMVGESPAAVEGQGFSVARLLIGAIMAGSTGPSLRYRRRAAIIDRWRCFLVKPNG